MIYSISSAVNESLLEIKALFNAGVLVFFWLVQRDLINSRNLSESGLIFELCQKHMLLLFMYETERVKVYEILILFCELIYHYPSIFIISSAF